MIKADPRNPRGIVWIASYPKSGNTWVRIFLYHLQRIMGGYPLPDHDLHQLDRSSAYEARLFGLFEQFIGKPIHEATVQEVTAVRPKVHAVIAERATGIALVKTHNVMGHVLGQPTVNLAASAGAIYVIRNPLDVAISIAPHNGLTIDQAIALMARKAYRTNNGPEIAYEVWGSWSEHVEGWTAIPHEAVHVVRYEDLAADPIGQFTAIAHHLRQQPTPEQIAEAVELSAFKRLRQQEDEKGFREVSSKMAKFFRDGRVGQWREVLDSAQVRHVLDDHSDVMKRFGYLPD
jgi:hypothetical protein